MGLIHDAPKPSAESTAPASAYSESYFPLLYLNWAPLRTIQDERWKFIDAPARRELSRSRARRRRARRTLRRANLPAPPRCGRALDALTGGQPGTMAQRTVDSETAAKLAALGYVGSLTPAPPGDERRDPKQMIGRLQPGPAGERRAAGGTLCRGVRDRARHAQERSW